MVDAGHPADPAAKAHVATGAAPDAAASDRRARGAAMQQRVYDAKMPADDPWLGLVPAGAFSGIADDGISRAR